jgi:DNA polymerase-3 subunit gamma/tau
MTYLVLARKYRPKHFTEMMGQDHVLRALQHALERNQLHHAYLFTGTRGVGKTTIARILAKCLNCERGVSPQPCGECHSCLEIDQGRHTDLLEIDAASRTKVEDTRDLLENVHYSPQHGRYKIYLIDEVHMLSGHSFNALLKTLEEPPPHVIFLLATTEPERLPVTVLSRCLQLHLKNMTADQIVAQLLTVIHKENITAESDALAIIAKAAQGSMRDALSLLDQAIAYSDGVVKSADVISMLGLTHQQTIVELLILLAAQDGEGLIKKVTALEEYGADFLLTLDSIIETLQQIAVAQVLKNGEGEINVLAEKIKPEDIQLYYQIALLGKRDLPLSPDPKSGFIMILIRMLAFTPHTGESSRHIQKPLTTIVPDPTPTVNPKADSSWTELLSLVNFTGAAKLLAQNCVLVHREATHFSLMLDENQSALLNPATQDRLTKTLAQHLGKICQVEISLGKLAVDSPAKMQQRESEQKIASAQQQLLADSNVQSLMQKFSATLQPDSIKLNE